MPLTHPIIGNLLTKNKLQEVMHYLDVIFPLSTSIIHFQKNLFLYVTVFYIPQIYTSYKVEVIF